MGGRVVSGIAIVMGGEASYNTIAINCSQYHFFYLTIFPFFLGKSCIFKKVMFAKKVTRTVVKEVEIWRYTSLLSPIPYPLFHK